MKNKTLLFIVLSLISLLPFRLSSQLEFSNWYFGQQAGLDFSTSPPTPLFNNAISTAEGCANISDALGNLQFYTNGVDIINSNHAQMANGGGLSSNVTSSQAAMIVKQPGHSNIYYVFTLWGNADYTIVDISLAAGLGSVTAKNVNTYTYSCEKQVAVRHCNGVDAWIINHEYGTNNFRAYLLSSSGLGSNPVISSVGPTIAGNTAAGIGHLKISPDGRKLAMTNSGSSVPASLGSSGFYLFDFDPASGIISNPLLLNSVSDVYGVEFSPDGTKLYGATIVNTAPVPPQTLYQWNVCAGSPASIISSQYTLNLGSIAAGSLQRAIDGKIYLAVSSNTTGLCVINNPNLSGAAMGYVANAISVSPKICRLGLPNFINQFTKPAQLPFTHSLACNSASFYPPPAPTLTGGCTGSSYPHGGYLWDFGEPSSGSANSSTLSNPTHNYSAQGSYTVKLVLQGSCHNDTLMQSVNISTLGPTPVVVGPSLICKGEKHTYTASGGTSYLWSTGATSTSVALQPTQTAVYSVTATANGCTQAKIFTVTVNPCLGLEEQTAERWKVYPNPVINELKIESAFEGTMKIFDLNGREVFQYNLHEGENTIATSSIQAGVYTLQLSNENFTRNVRMVKVE